MVETKVRIGLLFNRQKASAIELAKDLLQWGHENGHDFVLPPRDANALEISGATDEAFYSSARFAVVIGGDGTFLRAARYIRGHGIPLYGVNVGRLGFLATGDPEDIRDDIEKIISGQYALVNRSFLTCSIIRDGEVVQELPALNEIAVTRGSLARPIELWLSANGQPFNELLADGLIVATPTGSTAYSLSAGGPIVPPHVHCIVLTPICSHALYARPFILDENDAIAIVAKGDCSDVSVSADGQPGVMVLPTDKIDIRLAADDSIDTITIAPHSYYELLRKKLLLGTGRGGALLDD